MAAKPLAVLISTLAIGWSQASIAQDSQNPEVATKPSSKPRSGDPAVAGEIIITAQRRLERLMDVPISVATAPDEDLQRAGPNSLESITKVTPGMYIQRATYGLSPTIRGIGSTLADPNNEQNVALYIDDIYYSVPPGNVFDLASVAGVEILKGPQGTLFGRNEPTRSSVRRCEIDRGGPAQRGDARN